MVSACGERVLAETGKSNGVAADAGAAHGIPHNSLVTWAPQVGSTSRDYQGKGKRGSETDGVCLRCREMIGEDACIVFVYVST